MNTSSIIDSRKRVLILTVLLAVFLLSTPVWAAIIVVDEPVDDDPVTNNDSCSLREAIIAANTDAAVDSCTAGNGVDTITLPTGTYNLSIAGTGENAGATGDLDISTDLTINGSSASTTIIDGRAIDRVFHYRAKRFNRQNLVLPSNCRERYRCDTVCRYHR